MNEAPATQQRQRGDKRPRPNYENEGEVSEEEKSSGVESESDPNYEDFRPLLALKEERRKATTKAISTFSTASTKRERVRKAVSGLEKHVARGTWPASLDINNKPHFPKETPQEFIDAFNKIRTEASQQLTKICLDVRRLELAQVEEKLREFLNSELLKFERILRQGGISEAETNLHTTELGREINTAILSRKFRNAERELKRQEAALRHVTFEEEANNHMLDDNNHEELISNIVQRQIRTELRNYQRNIARDADRRRQQQQRQDSRRAGAQNPFRRRQQQQRQDFRQAGAQNPVRRRQQHQTRRVRHQNNNSARRNSQNRGRQRGRPTGRDRDRSRGKNRGRSRNNNTNRSRSRNRSKNRGRGQGRFARF